MHKNFEDLVKKLSPTLRRITYKLNGHFSFFDDDDLFQEALAHLWILFQKGEIDDKTDSYILQGCYFHLKNYLRKTIDKANLISISGIVDEAGFENMPLIDKSPYDDALEGAVLSESIKLLRLTKREKDVLRLCLEDFTVREVGKKLAISHVMVIKVKKKLRSKLKFLKLTPFSKSI